MCGIVGYIGDKEAGQVLINGLRRLEYRGYDSAGVSLTNGDELCVVKRPGKVAALSQAVQEEPGSLRQHRVGVAHTRWATHGPPTQVNAHPHLDRSGRIAMVHNGIIENYRDIRAHLEQKGHAFDSETDSEVLAHLIGDYYQGNLLEAVCAALQKVEGTFGIAVICQDEPDQVIAARRGSPIVIGVGKNECVVASDAAAVVAVTQQVIYLDDNDVAIVTPGAVDIRDLNNVPVNREISELEWSDTSAELGGFEHFMLKEIHEQPDSIRNAIRGRMDFDNGTAVLSGLGTTPREISEVQRAIIVGCGTSMNAGMVGEYAFENFADMPTEVEQAAEFRYRNPIIKASDFVLAISQSGETADTLAAVREAIQKGAWVSGICNVVGSTIARETGRGIYLHAGPEISVASTKAFTCQVAVLLMIALKFGRCGRLSCTKGREIAKAIESLPMLVEQVLERNDIIAKEAEKWVETDHAFFIGRGYQFPVALEGALKLKEISYIHAEGYHAAELKHGPIALLESGIPVVALVNEAPGKEKTIGNAHECAARGARIVGLITEGDTETAALMDSVIEIPKCPDYVAPVPMAVALQLLSYHVARLRGCAIDQPRNLAKSVTVE